MKEIPNMTSHLDVTVSKITFSYGSLLRLRKLYPNPPNRLAEILQNRMHHLPILKLIIKESRITPPVK